MAEVAVFHATAPPSGVATTETTSTHYTVYSLQLDSREWTIMLHPSDCSLASEIARTSPVARRLFPSIFFLPPHWPFPRRAMSVHARERPRNVSTSLFFEHAPCRAHVGTARGIAVRRQLWTTASSLRCLRQWRGSMPPPPPSPAAGRVRGQPHLSKRLCSLRLRRQMKTPCCAPTRLPRTFCQRETPPRAAHGPAPAQHVTIAPSKSQPLFATSTDRTLPL